MYYDPHRYPIQYPYYVNAPMYNYGRQYWEMPDGVNYENGYGSFDSSNGNERLQLKDYGPKPFVVNIHEAAKQNKTYRTALWTGTHLQVTLMSLKVGEDIGLEMHPHVDQFLRIEQGKGIVQMGNSKDNLSFQRNLTDDSAIMVPAGTWHNIINTGKIPLRLYTIYAPPNHPSGTVQKTKADAMAGHGHGNRNPIVFGRTPDQRIRYPQW